MIIWWGTTKTINNIIRYDRLRDLWNCLEWNHFLSLPKRNSTEHEIVLKITPFVNLCRLMYLTGIIEFDVIEIYMHHRITIIRQCNNKSWLVEHLSSELFMFWRKLNLRFGTVNISFVCKNSEYNQKYIRGFSNSSICQCQPVSIF